LAGANSFRCYNIALYRNNVSYGMECSVFPIAYQWLQAWMKTDSETLVRLAHSSTLLLLKKEGCMGYIERDVEQMETLIRDFFRYIMRDRGADEDITNRTIISSVHTEKKKIPSILN